MVREEHIDLLHNLVTAFQEIIKKTSDFEMKRGDGDKPLAYLATRAFQDRTRAYVAWLTRPKPEIFGTQTPLEILSRDPESSTVKKALIDRWLRGYGLVVTVPEIRLPYKMVVSPGGFISFKRVAG